MTAQPLVGSVDEVLAFAETPYGIVKRLRAVERWASRVCQWRGKEALSILDYGCGTGDHVTYPLARLGHHVLGVDYHVQSIDEANRRYRLSNLAFRVMDIDELVAKGQNTTLSFAPKCSNTCMSRWRFSDRSGRWSTTKEDSSLRRPVGMGPSNGSLLWSVCWIEWG